MARGRAGDHHRRFRGRQFWKMSGSGNDFVFFDARQGGGSAESAIADIQALCDRRTGVGADGVVFLENSDKADFRMVYFNSDGSRASFCGNAALCSVRLAVELGAADLRRFRFDSDSGPIVGRFRDGEPEIDLSVVSEVEPVAPVAAGRGEARVGFALAGVPHAVILCADADSVELEARGPVVRRDPWFRDGANVDFVSRLPDGWRMRTYERGVEGETLACGTGAVASAILLAAWGEHSGPQTRIVTSSGSPLVVTLSRAEGSWLPSLRGSAVVTFEGTVGDIGPPFG